MCATSSANPLPKIHCRISLIAGSPIIEGTERSGWQLDLTTVFEAFQITNVHPPDGYEFADSIDGDSQLSQETGDVSVWIQNGTVCSTRDVGEDNAGNLGKMNWLPPRDSNPDNLLQRQVS